MSNLERARAHLLYERANLAAARHYFSDAHMEDEYLRKFESAFLAALSWVWEEQCNESLQLLRRQLRGHP